MRKKQQNMQTRKQNKNKNTKQIVHDFVENNQI
jgi:hypothetical protein